MFCHKCGKEVVENADFCIHCGSAVIKVAQPQRTGEGESVDVNDISQSDENSCVNISDEETSYKKKKIIKFLFGVICFLCVAIVLACIGKGLTKHPIDKFANKIASCNNYQMTYTISGIPLVGTITREVMVDGNVQYEDALLFSGEQYTETVGDVQYIYSKNNDGTWKKTQKEASNDSSNDIEKSSLVELFNSKNYEKVKGEKNTYKQKSNVDFGDYKDVVIIISKDSFTIKMTVVSGGVSCDAQVVFYNIGGVKLTLPKVK